MPKDKGTLETRVERLEQTAAAHEQRLTALETRLDPKVRDKLMAAELDLLLGELAGLGQETKAEQADTTTEGSI